MSSRIGDLLVEIAERARNEVILVAPFVKVGALERLVEVVPDEVQVEVVTRWRPAEVAAGVSDLGVLDVVRSHGKGRVLLLHDLHAKYYRFDERVLVGSANLTGRALGWVEPANVELLVEHVALPGFEEDLIAGGRVATSEIAARVEAAAALIPADRRPPLDVEDLGPQEGIARAEMWLPQTRQPADLFVVYMGEHEAVSKASLRGALVDLSYLAVPSGLSERGFAVAVRGSLESTEIFARCEREIDSPRRFGEMREWLGKVSGLPAERAGEVWQTLLRWLLYFFPDRYERLRPRHTEIIRRRTGSL